jgi:AcrR family transcriptional regulator
MLDHVSSQTTKTRIMDAAEDVVTKLGASHLTFDALVKETGLSKGGILYHFPSKKELLRAMVKRMIDTFDQRREFIEGKIEQTGLVKAKTYTMASFDKDDRYQSSSTALMAAAASDPELLEIVREQYHRNFAEIRAAHKDKGIAALIYMAVDGIWLLDSLQLCLLTDNERKMLRTMLLNMADGKRADLNPQGDK